MKNKADISKVGKYGFTKDGVVEYPAKWLKTKFGYKDIFIAPHHPMYNTIKHYGKYEEIDEVVIERMRETD